MDTPSIAPIADLDHALRDRRPDLPRFTGSVARRVDCWQGMTGRLPTSVLVDLDAERFGDCREFDQQEVDRRRFPIGSACLAELSVEFSEELLVDANRTPAHWRV
jgi:hypothetical protein